MFRFIQFNPSKLKRHLQRIPGRFRFSILKSGVPTARILPLQTWYVLSLTVNLRHQYQGTIRFLFQVFPKVTDPAKQDEVVYKVPCECSKIYIGEWEDLCMNGLKNTIETYGLLEPNPPPFQNTAMRRGTIRSGMR